MVEKNRKLLQTFKPLRLHCGCLSGSSIIQTGQYFLIKKRSVPKALHHSQLVLVKNLVQKKKHCMAKQHTTGQRCTSSIAKVKNILNNLGNEMHMSTARREPIGPEVCTSLTAH